jgi:flagellin
MSTIGTNIAASNAQFYLNVNNDALTKSIKRLASGSRLADPTDDAAGVAVSGKLDATIRRLQAVSEGSQNVISFAQTADGFLKTVQEQLTRMSELAARATNGSFGSADRAAYASEFSNLQTQINNLATNAKFNGSSIFTTTAVSTAINADGVTDTLALVVLVTNVSSANTATQLNIDISALAITSTTSATAAIASLATSIENLTKRRADLNADIAKFQFHVQNVRSEKINVEAANGRIKDLDVATESTMLAKNNILLQASTAMLAQANASQQAVLSLLR